MTLGSNPDVTGRTAIPEITATIYTALLPIPCPAAKAGENLVYRSLNAAGDVNYTGITGNLERRAAEQLTEKGIRIQPIEGLENLSRADARAVEQVLIETHGLGRDGGTLLNKINSISPNNPIYQQSIQRGNDLLRQAGYPGF